MNKHIAVLVLALVIVMILGLYMVSFTVRFNHSGLVLTFGKVSREVNEAGLQWKWPWPIQKVMRLDQRIRTYHRRAEETQTFDKQTIVTQVYVNWRINDEVEDFYNSFYQEGGGDQENLIYVAEKMIDGWTADAKNVITEYSLSELVTQDASRFKLEDLERSMLSRLQEKVRAGGGYGIEIIDVGVSLLGVPDAVTEKVFARMISDRDKESRTLIAQGESAAEIIKGEAERRATEIRAEAQAEGENIRGQGDAAAAEYLKMFLANPEFANFLRKIRTLTTTLNERTTLILDSNSPAYELFKKGPPQIIAGDLPPDNKDKDGAEEKEQIKDKD